MKLFISYSHCDKQERKDLDKHLAVLKSKENLLVLSDVNILPGQDLIDKIDENIHIADIVCLLLSANYFASVPCQDESKIALKKMQEEKISVIPIILSPCAWKDTVLSGIKALPVDGLPISNSLDQNKAWLEVYEGIKNVLRWRNDQGFLKKESLAINEGFKKELEATELSAILGMDIGLRDIFISPDFKKVEFDEKETIVNFNDLIKSYIEAPKNIIISGDRQSGKSAIMRSFFPALQGRLLPICLDCADGLPGKLFNIIEDAFKSQYITCAKLSDILPTRILLLDNFHKLKTHKRKEVICEIQLLTNYRMIATVDDIYDLGIREHLQKNFLEHYKIKDMGLKLRDQLVCKWMELQKKDFENETIYRDELNGKINTIVDKTIVPAYPFFLYTIIGASSISTVLDSEITSQGHCYQALIYIALRRIGVKDVQIDMYINFLSELANFIFRNKTKEVVVEAFNGFLSGYCAQFTVTVGEKVLVENLLKACLLKESISGYLFKHLYIYYYFLGKYFSDHLDSVQSIVESAIDNLQEEENGYFIIFLIHHTKNMKILEHIKINLMCLFDQQKETSLANSEVAHLEKYFEKLTPIFVDKFNDVEGNRVKALEEKEHAVDAARDQEKENINDASIAKLRKAIKTVEVAGQILKNRFGSLKKDHQREIIEMAMSVYLRVTDFFLTEFRRNESDFIEEIGYLVAKKIEKQQERGGNKRADIHDKKEIREIASRIYFEFNFMVCFATIKRSSYALGSKELLDVFQDVCDQKNTPLSMLVKRQALAMYKNSLNPSEIKKECYDAHPMVKRLLTTIVLDHFYMHKIKYDDRQKIVAILGINEKVLQMEIAKHKTKL